MARAQRIGTAPHVRNLIIDQRQEEVVAGRRGGGCLPSPKAAGERVRAARQDASVGLTGCATQGVAATGAEGAAAAIDRAPGEVEFPAGLG